jgi:predicted kinase
MKQLIVLVGPPGSGKSTLAKQYEADGYVRVSQDDQGKNGHRDVCEQALDEGKNIVIDRMNFSRQQRHPYLSAAKIEGYETHIIVVHLGRSECFKRMMSREDHPTIKDSSSANSALNTFFSKYERPQSGEADNIKFVYPGGEKPEVVVCDLDGTLCNLDKRLHHVRKPAGEKKDWKSFFEELVNDEPNRWCFQIMHAFAETGTKVVYASGRPDDYKNRTEQWLYENNLDLHEDRLYMRCRGDHREDFIAKEIILDFEILTRWTPIMFIDDRQQVVDFWRSRGFTALQCAKGDF